MVSRQNQENACPFMDCLPCQSTPTPPRVSRGQFGPQPQAAPLEVVWEEEEGVVPEDEAGQLVEEAVSGPFLLAAMAEVPSQPHSSGVACADTSYVS
jgi:hypothetical protein